MSRGPGSQQEGILRALEDGGAWTSEALRWFLFFNSNSRDLSPDGKLPNSWNTSFGRAVQRLNEKDRISIHSRPLETFQECAAHYPGKTLRSDARNLRMELLPVLHNWIGERGGLRPKYGIEANERYHLHSLPKDTIQPLTREWRALEERLRPI